MAATCTAPRDESLDLDINPVTWFAEMLIAQSRGQFRRAAEAQDQLARLGWDCHLRTTKVERKGAAR